MRALAAAAASKPDLDAEPIEQVIGRKGNVVGGVLQLGIPCGVRQGEHRQGPNNGFDGKTLFSVADRTIGGAGKVAPWTKGSAAFRAPS